MKKKGTQTYTTCVVRVLSIWLMQSRPRQEMVLRHWRTNKSLSLFYTREWEYIYGLSKRQHTHRHYTLADYVPSVVKATQKVHCLLSSSALCMGRASVAHYTSGIEQKVALPFTDVAQNFSKSVFEYTFRNWGIILLFEQIFLFFFPHCIRCPFGICVCCCFVVNHILRALESLLAQW